MTNKTVLTFSNIKKSDLPEDFSNEDDVRYTPELVRHFIDEFTRSGDVVFDPFSGFGTTLVTAEQMGRDAYGIEFDEKRARYIQSQMKHPERAIHGDSLNLLDYDLPDFDFVITSPPYMGRHHKENPFTAYSTEGNGYHHYLADLGSIFEQIAMKMKPGAKAVVEISNLKHDDATPTPLAWDVGKELSEILTFVGETIINWQPTYGFGYDHSYALIFKAREV
jgi:hypothetical protein